MRGPGRFNGSKRLNGSRCSRDDASSVGPKMVMRLKVVGFALCAMLFALCFPVEAQQAGKVPLIGFLHLGSGGRVRLLREGLRELGYVDGQNIVIEVRAAGGKRDRLPALADELVRLKPDVIVIHGSIGIRAVQRIDKTIPIVFPVHTDPVGSGDVASLARPGGNVTGLSDYHTDLVPKRLELLKEVVPTASSVAVLWDPAIDVLQSQWKLIQTAAPRFRVTLLSMEVSSPDDFDRALATMSKERPGGLVVFGYPTISRYGKQTVEFALKNRLPTIFTTDRNVVRGGLMSYGAHFPDLYRRAAAFVDKILKGAKPADLPVEQPARFNLVINLKTAKQIGVTIPDSVLFRADKVIK